VQVTRPRCSQALGPWVGLSSQFDALARPDGTALGQDRDGRRRERDGTKEC
jgi:hypothetical protein